MLDARFIEAIGYTKLISNLVIVPNSRIKICIDFRYVNKDFPKDDFPLPNIDILVENIMVHDMFSFMDGFSRYNQILITEKYRHKMTFTTPWGNYYYRVMLYGLNNTS